MHWLGEISKGILIASHLSALLVSLTLTLPPFLSIPHLWPEEEVREWTREKGTKRRTQAEGGQEKGQERGQVEQGTREKRAKEQERIES